MKKFLILIFTLFFIGPLNASDFKTTQETVFKAMRDEMARTMKSLKTKGMPRPYYATYKVKIQDFFAVNSFMGEEFFDALSKGDVSVSVTMRVGNEKTDSSFFENTVITTAGSQLPSLSYGSLRQALWLKIDQAYKQALDQYTKKLAYLKKKEVKEENPDFSKAEISSDKPQLEFKPFDKDYIISLAEEMSAQGNVKELKRFYTRIFVSHEPTFYLSSEGAEYIKDESNITIYLSAQADTPEGFPLNAYRVMVYKDMSELPSKEELIKTAKDLSLEMQKAVNSPKGEAYIGPVLLEEEAAATLFDRVFAKNAQKTKKVLSLNRDTDYDMGDFARKKGLRIMPSDFNVTDDPQIESFNGRKLMGAYKVDDEGVAPKKLQIVKNGKLTDLPATRSSGETNGHARLGFFEEKLFAQASVSNLFFLPQRTFSKKELKEELMKTCRKENLDYCYIIRRFDGSNIMAYKVDAKTGEETLTYGLEMPSLSTRTLRDIIAAGDDLNVFNFASNTEPYYSIISPSVILSEMELKESQVENKKPPKLKKPPLN